MIIFISVLLVASICTALPYAEVDTQNVVTVPPNCPPGQQWINGQCRDVWRAVTAAPSNIITVPPNCPPGQQWVNGQCRDIWKSVTAAPSNVITVPPNCPPGQQWINGRCRDVWIKIAREQNNLGEADNLNLELKNTVVVPPNCRPGQQWVNGQCRDIWRFQVDSKNVVTVPPNCPPGQQFVNGQCRPIWKSPANAIEAFFNDFRNNIIRKERQVEIPDDFRDEQNRNVINVPNQCPVGYRPDALGICRPIMF